LKKLIIFPLVLLSLLAVGQPAWKQSLRYQLEAKLDDRQQTVDGKMKLFYTNHSPDTLHFIWFQVWPNAYRNDQTRYSEQLLGNGKTGFYFSDKEQKGYINRLEFRANGVLADIEDHPEYIDVVKLVLPGSLLPGDSIQISASFHLKLPYNFSGYGHKGQTEQISNWYPEPAVYDRKGWHPMPFLEQGGAFHETADYQVAIEVPRSYILAAGCSPDTVYPNHSGDSQTYRFSLHHANSFAWIANKKWLEKKDSVLLENGKQIRLAVYYFPKDSVFMFRILGNAKPLIRELSKILFEYPYASLNIAEAEGNPDQSFSGLMRISVPRRHDDSESRLRSALAAQWFQAICLSDERKYPWMSKGFIYYYNQRLQRFSPSVYPRKLPLQEDRIWVRDAEKEKTSQPINSTSDTLSRNNYFLMAAVKSGQWIKSIEDSLGQKEFDRFLQTYFDQWKFGHPDPEDFKSALEKTRLRRPDSKFAQLNRDQPLSPVPQKKLRLLLHFSAANSEKYNDIDLTPALGYNRYDDLMLGVMLQNYKLPENNFQFLLMPLYSRQSKTWEGIGRVSYSWHPSAFFRKITVGLNASRFSSNRATDSTGRFLFEGFSKIVPYFRLDLNKNFPRSSMERWIDFKSYLINEKDFSGYALSAKDTLIHPNSSSTSFRYLNQLSFNIRDERKLYPYDARIELQQSDLFYRINLTAHYFLNYPSGGGMSVRFFAAKFGVWTSGNNLDLSRYEPKLLGVTGQEDYTYDQYFIGRSSSYAIENTSVSNGGLPAQQIMIRDGGLKLRIDAYDYVQGRSANWVSALNFSTTLPAKLFPVPIPIRLFFDVGTYAEAWNTNALTSRFLYTGGIQLSLFHNLLNIYAPLLYSSDFRDLIKTEGFGKRITFSIDIQNLDHKSLGKLLHHELQP
jgi:hypothetical protein